MMAMAMIIPLLMLLQPSRALLAAPSLGSCRVPIRRRSRALARASGPSSSHFAVQPSSTSSSSSSSSIADERDVVASAKGLDDIDVSSRGARRRTALLWLSPSRLRLRDNSALTEAAELGRDGLTVCLVWPYDNDGTGATSQMTAVEAFGYAALCALNDALGESGQTIWLIPSRTDDSGEEDGRDPLSSVVEAVRKLNPGHVVVDVCMLDRHRDRASKLRDKLQSMNDGTADDDPNVVEIVDDGLLIPLDRVPKVLGRSRQGGRALRWSTFLSNTMAMRQRENIDKPTWEISSLPPPMHTNLEEIIPISSIPSIATFPPWARRLLSDWGEISEDEAMRRAASGSNNASVESTSSASSLTEKGSKDTKLSPYLRWGVISPQRAASAGVRPRDLLWRDWSHVSYGLLGPLRRGDAVLEFMDRSCRRSPPGGFDDDDDVVAEEDEESLFDRWRAGDTGSGMVDAGMRQLWKEGWMPRRVRLLAAACLVEGMGVDWRRGRDWFEETLIDHDPAINELMWQNSGLCGVDPFYSGIAWEAPPRGREEEEYAEKWSRETLAWPSSSRPRSTHGAPNPSRIVDGAGARREVLRAKGVYRAARTVGNAGVRVAWKGLSDGSVEEGEVMGAGRVPVGELRIGS